MALNGMTGFARAEGELPDALGGVRWTWELKSVNGRGLDLKLRTPSGYDGLEQAARAAAQKRFKRGSIQASLTVARESALAPPPRVDAGFVASLLEAGAPFIDAKQVRKPRWDGLLNVRGVLIADEAELSDEARGERDRRVLAGFDEALNALAQARASEGAMLAGVLGELAGRMETHIAEARANAAAGPDAALERLRQRLAAIAPDVAMDQQRLAQEAALIASKADVQEELDRLSAHARDLRALIASDEPAGRKLDFLGQELTREANTLCSKSADLDLTRIGLALKAVVDQIKEQAANVE